MMLRKTWLVALSALFVPFGVRAAGAADDPLDYSDPGMHFRPPDGWERVPLQEAGTDSETRRPPLALYVFKKNKGDQRLITITMDVFQGSLDGFARNHANELRQQGDSTFIEKQEKTTLANGMPAIWMKVNQGANLGQMVRRYEYIVIDLSRGIIVSYFGRAGDFEEKEAKAALASLYVVVYPKGRP
jgi:hypothetical protein